MSDQSYPGTAALSAEVKQRVVSTFLHTLETAKQGNHEEANVGCDFILKLDPMFEPARQLIDQLGNPFVAVDYDDLAQQVAGANPSSSGDPLTDARQALAERDFNRALEITSALLREDLMNTEAQEIAEDAQSKLEASPFIEQFVKSARTKMTAGNLTGAMTDLTKARQLDDKHPQVVELERQLSEAAPSPSAPAAVADVSFDAGGSFGSPFGSGFAEAPSPDAFSSGSSQDYSFEAPGTAPAPDYGFATPVQPAGSGFGFNSTPSFVVEAGPGAAAPPATEFGFTFEEDQKVDSGFPSSTPSPFATPSDSSGEANTFDFTTASVETTVEDQQQISTYLRDGDELFDAGEFQRAIDTWSKIFLIDVTNDDASQRIEKARMKRLETDRRVEELVVAGTLAFEKNDIATASSKFEQVLQIDPNHFNAREYLARIEGGGSPAGAASPPMIPMIAPLDDFDDDFADPSFAPSIPPMAAAKEAASKKTMAPAVVAAPKKGLPMLPIAAVLALLILGGAGYFFYSRMASSAAEANPAETAQLFSRAETMAKSGKFDQAIAALSAIKPSDPEHDRALEMIADLKNQKAASSGMIDGRPAAEVFAGLLVQGRQAFETRDYLTAKQAFDQASTIQGLPTDARQMYDASAQQVAKLETAMVLLRENRYDEGIANLTALQQQDPGNTAVRKLLQTAQFNAGATAMQQGQTEAAMTAFDRALAIDPDDASAKRSRELAARYDGKQKDLLYRIYVKYLPLRSL